MLPIGLFGTSVAQAAFPILSQASARNDKELFKKTLVSGINQMLFFILPMSVFFIVFVGPKIISCSRKFFFTPRTSFSIIHTQKESPTAVVSETTIGLVWLYNQISYVVF